MNSNILKAEAYYNAICAKDLAQVAEYLHPDVHLLSPVNDKRGKEAVLAAVGQFMNYLKGMTIRARFASENQAVLIYDAQFPGMADLLRSTAFFTFKDDLIVRIELFFDTRPFGK